jgi:hypothetical protein
VDGQQQRALGLLDQPVEPALITVDPAIEVAADGMGRRRVRVLLQQQIARREAIQEGQCAGIEREAGFRKWHE